MSYGADFANADPANAPLNGPLFIGADPFFWGAILLGILAAGLIGWLIGHYFSRSKTDAAEAIWTAVNNAVKDAMKANTEALPTHAADLRRVLEARLGKTLKFGGELASNVKVLDVAITGETEDKSPTAPPPAPAAAAAATKDASAAAAAANVTIVSVLAQPASSPAVPAPSAKPGKRPMTTQERNDALRLAVAKFDDYWRHKKDREDDIREVVAELTNPGPKLAQHTHGPAGGLSGSSSHH